MLPWTDNLWCGGKNELFVTSSTGNCFITITYARQTATSSLFSLPFPAYPNPRYSFAFASGSVGSQTTKHILVHFELMKNKSKYRLYKPIRTQQLRRLWLGYDDCRINCLKINYRTGYAKHSASTAIRPIVIKIWKLCNTIVMVIQNSRRRLPLAKSSMTESVDIENSKSVKATIWHRWAKMFLKYFRALNDLSLVAVVTGNVA